MKTLIELVVLFSVVFSAQAESLYIDQLRDFSPDKKELKQALKQLEEHEAVVLKKGVFVGSFHKQKPDKATDKKAFCTTCHSLPPHRQNERKRSFLNMHSRYISCETCHFRPENISLEYRWLNFNDAANGEEAKRIAPFYAGQFVPVFADDEFSKQTAQSWENMSLLEKSELKLKLHSSINKEGTKCLACHDNKKQLLDLKALGFDKKEIGKLQKHAIPRFFSRFNKEDQRLRMSDLLR